MKKGWLILLGLILISACTIGTMPSKDPWYAQHFFIMQDFERDIYRSLSPAGKLEFQKIFWEERPAAAREEFDKRMEFIFQNYKRENFDQPWNTDRARIYLLNGPPAFIESHVNDSWSVQVKQGAGRLPTTLESRSDEDIGAATLEVWAYNYRDQIVYYPFIFEPPNKWRQAELRVGGYRYMGELELKNKREIFGVIDENAYREKLRQLKSIK